MNQLNAFRYFVYAVGNAQSPVYYVGLAARVTADRADAFELESYSSVEEGVEGLEFWGAIFRFLGFHLEDTLGRPSGVLEHSTCADRHGERSDGG